MKLIMENWRGFIDDIDSERLFENHDHIVNVLGIELPLTEGEELVLTEEKKAEILREHMLHEGFISSMLDAAKEAGGKIKDLFAALYKIFKDGDNLKSFIGWVERKVIKQLAKPFRDAFAKMKQIGGKVGDFIESLSQKFESLLGKLGDMAYGWKRAVAGMTIAVLVKWAYEKAKELLEDAIAGDMKKELLSWLKEKFAETFGQALLDKALAKVADVRKWLGWIGPVVGGVNFVADVLAPATGRMATADRFNASI